MGRVQIEKLYYTLPEIMDRWSISETDLIYLAENDRLRLSVRVFGLGLECGHYEETDNGRHFRVPSERSRFSGLLDLHARDVFQLYRCGELEMSEFRRPDVEYASIRDGVEPIMIMIGDLLLRREERDRFEVESGFSAGGQPMREPAFIASDDYQDVRCHGIRFKLGPIQALVVRALHDAARAGEPWQNGKAILSAAGSRSLKMSDVFKSQDHWRQLIRSNRRGDYRLVAD